VESLGPDQEEGIHVALMESIGNQRTLAMTGASERIVTDLSEGQQLGQYLVLGSLGSGAMGEVYLVEHQILQALYALKLLRRQVAHGEGVKALPVPPKNSIRAHNRHP